MAEIVTTIKSIEVIMSTNWIQQISCLDESLSLYCFINCTSLVIPIWDECNLSIVGMFLDNDLASEDIPF